MPGQDMAQRVEAIPGVPFSYGLVSVATVLDPTDIHEMNGVVWQPMSCAEAFTTTYCPPDEEEEVEEKTFDGAPTAYGTPVTIYYGHKCPPIGQDNAEAERYTRAGLAIGEPRALERWVWQTILAPDAVDMTPVGGPVGMAESVSTIEAGLADLYGGVGIIHAPAGAAAILGRDYQLVQDGARYRTWLGNRVALGVGYQVNTGPIGDAAPAGTVWLFASGPVIIRRQSANPDIPGDQDSDHIDIVLNDRLMLAERTWVVGYECSVVACLVDLGSCCGGSVS